ncbi:hypothetical protein BpHYR1_015338 [Brachionus plicatilis]|uniref:Uncharacterized protein n=1 Tax=Brachionus plicatilis TaxID=10195 RepID=A0A3M7PZV8_BRAPC|nr:hypothetical protein BpHYR1_015338 [Brachionus plicatilis]
MENYDELEQKLKYYKSNPLRNFAPTRGQPIVPHRHQIQQLPKIFNELRFTDSCELDRSLHRQKIKSNLSLKLAEPMRNPLDQMESSKKTYNEFSRLNLTRPIDISNVRSVLRENISPRKDETTDAYKRPKHLSKSADLLIDAHNVDLKYVEDMNSEIRKHKQKLAKLEFKSCKWSNSKKAKNSKEHKGALYHYRKAVREIKSMIRFNSAETKPPSAGATVRGESHLDNKDVISKDHSIIKEYEYLNKVMFSNSLTSSEKYRKRVKQARDKILYEQTEKHNLNRMTILQPFEDTKILINIDQVPPGFLNSLLNKENHAPRYYMPPVRAFGYYKKVPNDSAEYDVRPSQNGKIKEKRSYVNKSVLSEFQAEKHNFNLESLKSLNESSNYLFNRDHSIFSNLNTNSSNNFDLKVDISKKDVSVK